MCLFPNYIKNPKYIPNKKNGGKPPFCDDIRKLYVPIACGQCEECMKKKAREWTIRLNEELREQTELKPRFATFTFNEIELEKLKKEANELRKDIRKGKGIREEDNEAAILAVRRFTERWRKLNKKTIRHWLVTELGHEGTKRIHLHGIIWTNKTNEYIEKVWGYGWADMGKYVNEKTINYIVKYIHKIDTDNKGYIPKVLTSKGIGANYINRRDAKNNKYKENETDERYRLRNGVKLGLPIYYRNKIYSEEEREKLWIEKINQQIRWVNGIKIDISKGTKTYREMLKIAQAENKSKGYNNKKWNEEKYFEGLKQRDAKTIELVEEQYEREIEEEQEQYKDYYQRLKIISEYTVDYTQQEWKEDVPF